MSDWPKEMNETELQFYHRSAHSLPVAFRLACREIDRLAAKPGEKQPWTEHHCRNYPVMAAEHIAHLEAQIAKPHFGMADARAEALTKQIAAWTAEVALANDNLKIIQTAKERRLREALKPIYEHCKNNMQICGIVEQAKAALKGE